MPRTRHPGASPTGSPDETEAAFYDALQRGDIELLMACWAEDDDIVCVQPGGPRLLGAGAIRAAFEAMFAHGTARHGAGAVAVSSCRWVTAALTEPAACPASDRPAP